MTAFLPPNLIALFQPREPVEFKVPEGDLPWERDRTKNPYSGIAPFVNDFDPSTETPPKVFSVKSSTANNPSGACGNTGRKGKTEKKRQARKGNEEDGRKS